MTPSNRDSDVPAEATSPAPAPENEAERIGPEFYDDSDYFEGASKHLRNLKSPFQRYRTEKVLEIYRPGKEARVLDLGCGWGTVSFALSPLVTSVVGVDFSARSVELCRKGARDLGLKDVEFIQADATDTGLAEESFDIVYAVDLLEHLYPDQTEQALDECARILKRGGRLVIWTPNPGHFLETLRNRTFLMKSDPSHVDYKSMEQIHRSLVSRGFSIEKAYYAESHVPFLREIERSFMASIPVLRRRIAVLGRKR